MSKMRTPIDGQRPINLTIRPPGLIDDGVVTNEILDGGMLDQIHNGDQV